MATASQGMWLGTLPGPPTPPSRWLLAAPPAPHLLLQPLACGDQLLQCGPGHLLLLCLLLLLLLQLLEHGCELGTMVEQSQGMAPVSSQTRGSSSAPSLPKPPSIPTCPLRTATGSPSPSPALGHLQGPAGRTPGHGGPQAWRRCSPGLQEHGPRGHTVSEGVSPSGPGSEDNKPPTKAPKHPTRPQSSHLPPAGAAARTAASPAQSDLTWWLPAEPPASLADHRGCEEPRTQPPRYPSRRWRNCWSLRILTRHAPLAASAWDAYWSSRLLAASRLPGDLPRKPFFWDISLRCWSALEQAKTFSVESCPW